MKGKVALVTALSLLSAILTGAGAATPQERLADPKLEARARAVSRELRCVVCQNQSIDDSNAPLAHDMRILVRERIMAGDSDDEVKSYLVARYGNFVLLKPPFNLQTWLLWLGPAIFLVTAAWGLYRPARARSKLAPDDPPGLSDDEERRLNEIQNGSS
ncbi:MAG: cytochrome c-type biogenesis protein [Parvularculaceae bacterium]